MIQGDKSGNGAGAVLVVGRVRGAFGCDGWIRVCSYTEAREDVARYRRWLIGGDSWSAFDLIEARAHGDGLVAKLAGINDRNAAAALRNRDLGIGKEQLPARAPGEYYWFELAGIRVVNLRGEALGTVSRLIATGANDVLEVTGDAATCLIPWVEGVFVKRVDTRGGLLEVDWRREWCDAR